MKIIDGFIFYNELELLKARLHELYNIVDYFILVEGTLTFTGNKKQLYYNENKLLFSKYNDKIIHIIVDDFPITKNPWDREYHQRRSIAKGIAKLTLENDDIIIISDVDEIPKFKTISDIKNNITILNDNSIYSLVMKLFYYTLDWTVDRKWNHVKALTYKKYSTINDPETIRMHSTYIPIHNSGWHISYYGDTKFIINKLESFSEQQDNNTNNKNISYLNDCMANGVLHFNKEKLIKNKDVNDIPSYFLDS